MHERNIVSLEKEFLLIGNAFKEEKKRVLTDYKSKDNEYAKKLALFLAYKYDVYKIRMHGVLLFGYISEQDDILTFMSMKCQKITIGEFGKYCQRH